jgi:hypothetical protein
MTLGKSRFPILKLLVVIFIGRILEFFCFILVKVEPFLLGLTAEGDQVALRVEILQKFPELSIVNEMVHVFILKVVCYRGASSQVKQRFVYKT